MSVSSNDKPNIVQVSEDNLTVTVVSSVGATGPAGPTGATGASGVVAVTAPITNSGTSSAANIGIDQTGITVAQSQVTNLVSDLAAKANLASPTLTGTPAAPTATLGTNTTQLATTAFVKTEITGTAVPLTWTTGQYERAVWGTASVGVLSMTLNRMYATAIYVPRGASIDRVAVEVTIGGSAGSVVRLGLYANGTNGVGGLLFDAGTVDTTSGGYKELTVSWTNLTGDIYWLVAVAQVAAPTLRGEVSNLFLNGFGPYNVGLNNAPAQWQVYQNASVSGARPSTFTTTANTIGPIMLVRA